MASRIFNEISESRENEIIDLAKFINETYSEKGILDPEVIAHDNDISFSYNYYDDSFDGILECIDQKFHIYINLEKVSSRTSGRARFTFCHELGHYFLDEHRIPLIQGKAPSHKSICNYSSESYVEREADIFATNLLMPEKNFLKLAKGSKNSGIEAIKELAKSFHTSLTSTFIRYVKLDIGKCAIFKTYKNQILWSWSSDSFYSDGYKYPIKGFEMIPRGSATFKRCNGEEKEASIVKTGSTASMWFNYIDDSSSKNIILIEEAINIGDYGVLTLIRPDSY